MTQRKGRNGRESSPVNDSGLTPGQVMEMGQAAAHLLNNPIYNVAHRMAVDEILDTWAGSRPEEVKKREALWAELQAHGRAAQHISALVDRARELVEAQGQTSMQDENEYMDQQGFGTFPEETADHTFN